MNAIGFTNMSAKKSYLVNHPIFNSFYKHIKNNSANSTSEKGSASHSIVQINSLQNLGMIPSEGSKHSHVQDLITIITDLQQHLSCDKATPNQKRGGIIHVH